MHQVQLTANIRTERGKGAAHRLRRQGFVPAILYGGACGNVALAVNSHDFYQLLSKFGGENVLIDLTINQEDKTKNAPVIIKDLQLDPVKRNIIHADFLEVTMEQVIEVDVHLELTGESPGVKAGGVLEFLTREIAIECLPLNVPDHIMVDISSLNIGDVITAADIPVGNDITVLTSAETAIVTVAPPLTAEVVEAPEEEVSVEPEVIQKGKKPVEEE